MDLTVVLEVGIGIMFVWILLALMTSQIQEWLSSILRWRSKMLEESIRNMLGKKDLADEFYNHPLIKSLHTKDGNRKPSYIPDNKFALVLFDIVMKAGSGESLARQADSSFQQLKNSISGIKENFPDMATTLNTLLFGIEEKVNQTDKAVSESRIRVEGWFNDAMDRLSGAYRRRTQIVAIAAGITLALILNADSIAIVNKLWRDPLVRQAVVEQAKLAQPPDQSGAQPAHPEEITKYVGQLQGLSIPLGWTADNLPVDNDFGGWMTKLIGILISGVAASQGAPFWFDLMNKVINLRNAVSVSATPAATPVAKNEPEAAG